MKCLFKRSAYGLIDYYLELEKEKRIKAEMEGWDDKKLETELDLMWGQVTLYNCYQLFVQLSSKTLKNPMSEFKARAEAGDFNPPGEDEDPNNLRPGREPLSDEEFAERKARVVKEGMFWAQKPEDDVLTLFFNATNELPQNSMRRLIGDADNSLKAMKGAEKMLASKWLVVQRNTQVGLSECFSDKLCNRSVE